jgi:hypothetical protein
MTSAAARQAKGPATDDEHAGELDARHGEEQPGEDAARAEARQRARLAGGPPGWSAARTYADAAMSPAAAASSL